MTDIWIPEATHYPITAHGYGPFRAGKFLGLVLHDNESNGRLESFFANSQDVTPNFQVYKTGEIVQYLPLDWQPWCQAAGNQTYAAVETEGYSTEALNAAQTASLAVVVKAYHDHMGMPLTSADSPGVTGFGVHYMGGQAWGGHSCPGPIRAGQRPAILAAAAPQPAPTKPKVEVMFEIVHDSTVGGSGAYYTMERAELAYIDSPTSRDYLGSFATCSQYNAASPSQPLPWREVDAGNLSAMVTAINSQRAAAGLPARVLGTDKIYR